MTCHKGLATRGLSIPLVRPLGHHVCALFFTQIRGKQTKHNLDEREAQARPASYSLQDLVNYYYYYYNSILVHMLLPAPCV